MGEIKSIKDGTRGCSFNDRFYFEAISASSNIASQGHAAYDGSGKIYAIETISSSSSSIESYTGEIWFLNYPPPSFNLEIVEVPIAGTANSRSSGNATNTYIYHIDEYGDIYVWMNTSMSGNSASSSNGQNYELCYPNGQGFSNSTSSYNAGGSSTTTGYVDECAVAFDTDTNCRSSSTSSTTITSASGNPNCGTTSSSSNGTDCGFPSFSVNDPNPSATTKIESSETSETVGCSPGPFVFAGRCTSNYNVNKNANLSEEVDVFGKNKQSVNTKLRLFEANQPHNCNEDICGEGEPEDCWSAWGGTSIAAKPTSQKWKTRVRKADLNDTELQRYTIVVESKYYLQIPIEDSDPIRILVDSGTDTFSGNQNRGSKHEFTNEDFQAQIGQPVYGCLNIKRMDRF
jgi:hypothetical protein